MGCLSEKDLKEINLEVQNMTYPEQRAFRNRLDPDSMGNEEEGEDENQP